MSPTTKAANNKTHAQERRVGHPKEPDLVGSQSRRKYEERIWRVGFWWEGRWADGVHGGGEMPGDPQHAWIWRQLNDELERRAGTSLEGLQSRSEKLREKLRRVTVDLIDRRAWTFQARRTSAHQR